MKTKFILLVIALISLSCKEQVKETKVEGEVAAVTEKAQAIQTNYTSYGDKITADNLIAIATVKEHYKNLKTGDTASVKFQAPIDAVCKSKGCWMRLDLGQEEEVFVKFKDYAFFVPTDATGEAIVQGKAFVEETSVEEQRHLAEDGGMSKEEVAAITEPKRELKLMAEGVLMKK